MAVNSHITVGYDELAHGLRRVLFAVLVFVVFVCFHVPKDIWLDRLVVAGAAVRPCPEAPVVLGVDQANAHLGRYEHKGEAFICRVITMDKTWIRSYTPELKRQSSEWRHAESHLFRAVLLTKCEK